MGIVRVPTTRLEAEKMGWFPAVRKDGTGICRPGLGVEYTENAETHSKARPQSLFFEGGNFLGQSRVSAFSVRAWFEDTTHYNPETWQQPAFGVIEDGERWVTITMRDPANVCRSSHDNPITDNALLGDRLIMNIYDQSSGGRHDGNVDITDGYLTIPTVVPDSPDGAWKFGACQADMSRHWGYPLHGNADTLYGYDHGVHVLPVIPMYSVPGGVGAGITALAFFTTEAQMTFSEGGIWDATGTPPQLCSGNFCLDADKCEYGAENSVLHVFFVDQWLEEAQCGDEGSPDCPAESAPWTA